MSGCHYMPSNRMPTSDGARNPNELKHTKHTFRLLHCATDVALLTGNAKLYNACSVTASGTRFAPWPWARGLLPHLALAPRHRWKGQGAFSGEWVWVLVDCVGGQLTKQTICLLHSQGLDQGCQHGA